MNSLIVVLSLLSGPDGVGGVPRVDAAEVFRSYYFNDALVDTFVQDEVIEIRGRIAGIKRVLAASEAPAAEKAEGPAPAPEAVAADSVVAYDAWVPVVLKLREDATEVYHVRCRFPASSRQRLAMLNVPNAEVLIRGRCLGIRNFIMYSVGPTVSGGPVLEFVDCKIVEVFPPPLGPVPAPPLEN